jgi:large subunit ribosomal protein L18
MRSDKKVELARKRRWRVRAKVQGTAERPRMAVRFSNQHVYVQVINDESGHTLVGLSTVDRSQPDAPARANVTTAQATGKRVADAALAKGIKTVVFDRGSARYHGKVKALATAAREAGLNF